MATIVRKRVARDLHVLDSTLHTIKRIITKRVVVDVATIRPRDWRPQCAERSRTEVYTYIITTDQVSADRWRPGDALPDIVIPIIKNTGPSGVVNDVVVRDEDTCITLRSIHEYRLTTGGDATPIYVVLVDRDVGPATVQPNCCRWIIDKAVILYLHVVVGPDTCEDATARTRGTSGEAEPINRDQPIEGHEELRLSRYSRSHD